MPREWGFWTRGKLELLQRYLDAFAKASTRASERLYLDLFAGEPENVDRITREALKGSPWISLSIASPPLTRLHFFQLRRADELDNALKADFPERQFSVHEGDSNRIVQAVLDGLEALNWAPAFAFVDPDGPDVWWTTLESLANFKASGKPKMELLILFPVDMFVRFLRANRGEVRNQDEARIDAMFGTDQWRRIYEDRLKGDLQPAEARLEYINLMRWRLERVLGYQWTHSVRVHNESGRPIYELVFATDHEAGHKIMNSVFNWALREFPRMRQHARDLRRGTQPLFNEYGGGPESYRHESPMPPYGDRIDS